MTIATDSFCKAILQNDTNSLKRFLSSKDEKFNMDQIIQDKLTAVQYSLKNNNVDMAKLLLENGANAQIKDYEKGNTYLHIACETGEIDMIKLLIQHIDINSLNNQKQTPLFIAVSNDKYEVAELLLKNKANVNIGDSHSPLFEATANKNISLIRLLLNNGADPNQKSETGYTPFHQYFRSFPEDKGELLELFFNHGADVNLKCDYSSESVLDLAATNSTCEVIEKLLQTYVNVNAIKGSDMTPLYLILTSISFYISANDYSEDTLLKKIRLFVQYGADVNAVNEDGRTPLFYVIKASNKRYFKVIKYLISLGADIYGDGVKSPIVELLKTGDLDMVEYLTGLGAKIDFGDKNIVMHVADYGSVTGLIYLIEHGAVFKPNNLAGHKIFLKAISQYKLEMVEFLLELGADVNFEYEKLVPLNHALKAFSPGWDVSKKVINVLIKHIALLAATDSDVHKMNMDLIESQDGWMSDIFNNYLQELKNMKARRLCLDHNTTYLDLLTKSTDDLIECMTCEIANRTLITDDFSKLYPSFCDKLQGKYLKWIDQILKLSILENTQNDSFLAENCKELLHNCTEKCRSLTQTHRKLIFWILLAILGLFIAYLTDIFLK